MTVKELEALQTFITGKQITVVRLTKVSRTAFHSEITIIVKKCELNKYDLTARFEKIDKIKSVGFICYNQWKHLENEKFFTQSHDTCINVKDIKQIKNIKDVAV